MRISVSDWLKLAYEDIITADDKVKALYDYLGFESAESVDIYNVRLEDLL